MEMGHSYIDIPKISFSEVRRLQTCVSHKEQMISDLLFGPV